MAAALPSRLRRRLPAALAAPRLRRIIAAYTINRLGTWLGVIAVSLVVFDHTRSALAVAAVLFAGQALPAFVVPAVVARVESSKRGGELSGLYFFEGVATAALAILIMHFWLPVVILLVALDGTAALAASALLRAEVAKTAREELAASGGKAKPSDAQESAGDVAERQANAALNVGFSATFMLGPAIAGEVVASAGGSVALALDAASFLICGAILRDLHTHVEQGGEASVRARLKAAWSYVGSVRTLWLLLLAEAVALVFFEAGAPIEVAFAKATLHAGDRGYGVLVAVWGLGGVIGSVVFAKAVRRSLGAMLTAGTLAVGLADLGFAAAPSLGLACAAAVLGGIGNGIQWASLISAVQRLTPPRLHGRLMGAVESIGALCLAIGLSLGGAAVALSSPRGAFLLIGVGATLTTVAFLRVSQSGFEGATADDPVPVAKPGRGTRDATQPAPTEVSQRSG